MNMKLDTLDALEDADLRAVIARAEQLLKQHDDDRKAKALADARSILAAAGLSLKNLAKGRGAKPKSATYQEGRLYRHPAKPELVWNAKGQKPEWLRELEAQGAKAVPTPPVSNGTAPVKKAATD